MSALTNCLGPIFQSVASRLAIDAESERFSLHLQSPPESAQQHPPKCRCCSELAELPLSASSQPPAYYNTSSPKSLGRGAAALKLNPEDEHISGILEEKIDSLSDELRAFSLKMFDYAELAMQEFKTHDLLASFMEKQPGWQVVRHAYGLATAVKAVFKHGDGGRTVGFNSEMDALPGIGHACGHPLICVSGIAAALATASVLQKTSTPGTVILLGTPAEESIGGKIMLIEKGAYSAMDACLMLHPAPYGGLLEMFAITQVKVEYFGRNAHAAGAPWEGINALDAAVSAYNSISVLRQQIHPSQRVHGIIQGSEKWVQNVIPAYSYLTYDIRAKSKTEMLQLKERVMDCFRAAALSSGCHMEITEEMVYDDLVNNRVLGQEYKSYMEDHIGINVPLDGPVLGSTDFGNVSYKVPAIHPIYRIPSEPNQGNHTIGFTKSSSQSEAHQLTMNHTKGIAFVAVKVLRDLEYANLVHEAFLKSNPSENHLSD